MKVLIYSLLLINLGVLAWFSWFVDEDEPPTLTSEFSIDESLPQLVLASEVQPGQGAFPDTADDGDDAIAADTPVASDATESALDGNEIVDPGRVTGNNLVTAVVQELLCVSLGPFQDEEHAGSAADFLTQNGYASSQRAADGQIRVGFWVNIVAGATRNDAEAIADNLRDRGVSDFYIVPGDDSNVISLGVYSGQKRAQRRHDELATLGFSPVIDDRMQDGSVQWLDFSMLDPALINPADHATGSGLPAELVIRPCVDIDAASG